MFVSIVNRMCVRVRATTALAKDTHGHIQAGFNSMVALSTNPASPAQAKSNMPIISYDTPLPALIKQNSVSEIELKGHFSWRGSGDPIKPKCHPHYTSHNGKDQSLIVCFHSKLTFKVNT